MRGEFPQGISATELVARVEQALNRKPIVLGSGFTAPLVAQEVTEGRLIKHVAWCTGGGQGYLETAAQAGVDAFITGEAVRNKPHILRMKYDVTFIGARSSCN